MWSNGKLKKVRGMVRPTPAPGSDGEEGGEPARLSISVLITLPLDSVVSPLLPLSGAGEEGGDAAAGEDAGETGDAEAPDGVGEGDVGARGEARPTARGPPKPGGGPRAERGRPPDGVAEGPPVAGGDGRTRGTCC